MKKLIVAILALGLFSSTNIAYGGFSSNKSSPSKSSSSSKSSNGFSSNKSSSSSSSKPSSGWSSKPSSSSGFSSNKSSTSSSSSKSSSGSVFDFSSSRRSIPPPKPKEEYISDFRAKNATKYTTSFDTQPAVRPQYIPPTTNYGGRPRNIEYNPQTKSYGFFDDLGKFMVYDAITDIALDSFKRDTTAYNNQSSSSGGGWGIFLIVLFLGVIGVAFYFLVVRKNNSY